MMSANAVDDLTGIAGFAARGIDAMGEWGVGLFTLAETIIPPIPSEVILPLAGFLTKQGTMSLGLVFVAAVERPADRSRRSSWGPVQAD